MSNCSNNFPTTEVLYAEIRDEPVIIFFTVLSGICFVAELILFIEGIVFIVKHYNHPNKKMQISTIMALYPVVGFMAFLALIVPRTTLIAEFLMTLFFAVSLLQFTHLIISYFGGERGMIQAFKDQPITLQTPPCCCCCVCLPKADLTKTVIRRLKIMIYQICFFRPVGTFISFILWADGRYTLDDANNFRRPTVYLNLLGAISTLFALYGLLILFRNTRDKLQGRQIIAKFLCLQLMVLFMNVQNTIISFLGRANIPPCSGTRDSNLRAQRIHFIILSIETLLLTILTRYAYRRLESEDDLDVSTKQKGVVNTNYQSTDIVEVPESTQKDD